MFFMESMTLKCRRDYQKVLDNVESILLVIGTINKIGNEHSYNYIYIQTGKRGILKYS